jgi:hypothetical protein
MYPFENKMTVQELSDKAQTLKETVKGLVRVFAEETGYAAIVEIDVKATLDKKQNPILNLGATKIHLINLIDIVV